MLIYAKLSNCQYEPNVEMIYVQICFPNTFVLMMWIVKKFRSILNSYYYVFKFFKTYEIAANLNDVNFKSLDWIETEKLWKVYNFKNDGLGGGREQST